MAEPPGSQLGLGIEAVEWLPAGESSITVMITGRWRRRPTWQGRPVLVVEAQGRRHRFQAIPDPPSVAGAAPGMWRISFSVPASLAPQLGVRAWLQLGAVLVPLPPIAEHHDPVSFQEESAELLPPPGAVQAMPSDPAQTSETPVADPAHRGDVMAAASELATRIKQLDAERRAATARAEAEERRRVELERQLSAPQSLRRASWREQLPAELELARRAPPTRDGAPRARIDGDLARRAGEQLRREIEAAAAARLEYWRSRAVELERQLRDSALRAEQLYEVIDELRSVLDIIRGVPSGEAEADRVAGYEEAARTLEPSSAVEPRRLDAALNKLREAIPPVEADDSGQEALEPAQEAEGEERPPEPEAEERPREPEAAERPREAEGEERPPEPEGEEPQSKPLPSPAPPTRKSWLLRTLRALSKDDPALAGRVALGLLPAQRLASHAPLAYELLLSDAGYFRLTAGDDGACLLPARRPHDRQALDFRLGGDLAAFARLLVAGPIRRRFERGLPELTGSRKALTSLLALIRTPYGLPELYAAGARLEPFLALTLIAWMIEPRWTVGHRFTIAHRGPRSSVYLRLPGGARPSVSASPPLGPVAATVVCEPEELLPVLAAEGLREATIRGRSEVIELLGGWVARAQRG